MVKIKLKYLLIVLVNILLPYMLVAQENSWINYNQQYFKIQVVKDGIYRIYTTQLVSSDVPVNLINANHIQLFHNGEEQYIHINGINGDGSLSTNGYIEFYGEKNRGTNEYDFYDSPESMINPEISFYNDTSTYFLTWNYSSGNRRMTVTNETDYNSHINTRQNYCIRHKRANYAGKYYAGNTRSYITQSEGWMDATELNSTGLSKTIATAGVYASGPDTEIEIAVGGINASNSASYYASHHLTVKLQGTTYIDTTYPGYEFVRRKFTVPSSSMPASTVLTFKTDYSENDKNAISYIDINYPHNWDFENTNAFAFMLPANGEDNRDYLEISNFASSNGAILYDLTNHERITTTNDGSIKALVKHTEGERRMLLVGSEGFLTPAAIRKVSSDNKFIDYLSRTPSANYVIVTHN